MKTRAALEIQKGGVKAAVEGGSKEKGKSEEEDEGREGERGRGM